MDKADKEQKSPNPPKAEKTVKPPRKRPPGAGTVARTEGGLAKDEQEQIVYINLSELHAFKNHPFQVRNDEEMAAMAENVKDVRAATLALDLSLPTSTAELRSISSSTPKGRQFSPCIKYSLFS